MKCLLSPLSSVTNVCVCTCVREENKCTRACILIVLKSLSILFYLQDSTDLQAAIDEKGQNEPYAIVCGDLLQPEQLMLVIDGHIVCDIDEHDIPFALMSAYFVFNICYVQGCHS